MFTLSCKKDEPAEETTSVPEEQNGDFSINITMSDYTIIDSTPAVPLGIYDKFEEQITTMKDPTYVLKAFDIKLPFNNNANGDFPIPRYLFMTLSGISVSSGDFTFEINGCLRGTSTNGYLDQTLTPGNKDATPEMIEGSLKKANATFVHDMDGGMDAYIGSSAVLNLSGGQK